MSRCFPQILAVHLLRAVLPSWDLAERAQDMEGLVQQLFSFLGGLLTTCSSDAPLLRGGLRPGPAPPLRHPWPQASPAAPPSCLADPVARRRARPQASLTATHSSTLAEETVALLRALHRLGQWRGLVSAHINARLRAAARGCGGHACGVRAAVLSHAAGCPGRAVTTTRAGPRAPGYSPVSVS